ncbi:Sugar kinase of the NBD/HSP70 family, may contain an N-terminal HTH domain [Nakamurella panacisegetis]|uniref:Sugar kinase of the NBD/HSP70 family, may contain an N-terminal HTH domain n=1 Tax=Nakamurella panacisegetis TaxID=1090615 RepID=A0A1H0LIJ9_9ACTN|nr:ROK family transcriptional regulator [Nakamurella panacisegetis]SDO67760.1 Sugar kinase of the NBD/HSP70 family, may contain an N-terminal HTH domain [Nakamurella panacisegetis]
MNTAESTATTPLLRRLNMAAVLEYLMGVSAVTGSEVMTATGLSRPTVHAACDHLINLGWVVELDGRRPEGDGRPGRPARCYQFNAEAGYVLGIDLGEHKVSVMLADLRGEAVATATERSEPDDSAATRLATTRRAIRSASKTAGVESSQILAASIGVPAPVTPAGRLVASSDPEYLPGMADVDIVKGVRRGHHWPVLLENDANLAVLGERWKGVGVGVDNLIVILSGERLGAGLVLGGQLIRGFGGGAGELTFLELVEGIGDTHGIGAFARIQARDAVATLRKAKRGPSARSGDEDSRHPADALLALSQGDPARITGDLVTAAARAGDPVAVEILGRVAERMARVVGVMATMLNPQMVVIGGASAEALELIHDPIAQRLSAYTKQPPQLERTRLGDRGVLLGAVRLALDHVQTHVFDALN